MSKLNEGLDPNNPSHQIVIEINNRNEQLFGPYNEKHKLFQAFATIVRIKLILFFIN